MMKRSQKLKEEENKINNLKIKLGSEALKRFDELDDKLKYGTKLIDMNESEYKGFLNAAEKYSEQLSDAIRTHNKSK